MTDARTIIYRLRAVQDPSSQAQIKAFGKAVQDVVNPKGRAGGGDGFGKMADGIKRATTAATDFERQMKRLNDTHNKRLAMEDAASKKNIAAINRQIAALQKQDQQEEAMARRAEEREHKRHRQRQRSTAMRHRSERGARGDADSLVDKLMDGGGKEREALNVRKLGKELREAHHGVMAMAEGFAYMGIAGEESSEKIVQSILKIQGVMHLAHGAMNIAKAGPMGMAALGVAAGVGMVGANISHNYQRSGNVRRDYTGRIKNYGGYDPDKLTFKERVSWARGAVGSWVDTRAQGLLGIHGQRSTPDQQVFGAYEDSSARLKNQSYASYELEHKMKLASQGRSAEEEFRGARAGARGEISAARLGAYSEGPGELRSGLRSMQYVDRLQQRATLADDRLRPFMSAEVARGRTQASIQAASFAGAESRQALAGIGMRRADLSSMYGEHASIAANANVSAPGGLEARQEAQKKMVEIEKEIRATMIEEGAIQKQLSSERIAAQREVIQSFREEKSERLALIQAEKDRYKSGAQKFGEMNWADQSRAIRIKQRIDKADQLDRMGAGAFAEKERSKVTKEDRAFIGGLGLRSTEDFREKANLEDAKRGGFFEHFREEKSAGIVGEQQKRIGQIDAKIGGNINFIVDLKNNADEQSKMIANQVEHQIKGWLVQVMRNVEADNKKMLAELNQGKKSKGAHDAEQAKAKAGAG